MITQLELKKELHYNSKTGVFTRLVNINCGTKIGDIAGHLNARGYIEISVKGKSYRAHRLAWFYVYGVWPKDHLDHINHDFSHNPIDNLREANAQENGRNRSLNKNNLSGIPGVLWMKRDNKWWSRIVVSGKTLHLGSFDDFFKACCTRKSAENKYGFHANHGR